MDHHRRHDSRRDRSVPFGLSLLMWQALARTPWLLGSAFDPDAERRHDAERRRRYDR